MRTAQPVIAVAAAAGLGAVAWVALLQDASAVAAQMHLSLFGWLSLGAFGLQYSVPGPVRQRWLALGQAAAAVLGFAAIFGGAAGLDATGDGSFAAVAAAGVMLAAGSLAVSVAQVLPAGARRAA